MAEAPKFFIKTYGCQMNAHDSERMADTLVAEGYEQTGNADEADMVLVNTCHIREKASEKLFSDLGRLRPLKERNPGLKIAVAGCVAQAEGEEIINRMPLVDIVVGPQAYFRLPEMIRSDGKVVDTEFPPDDKFEQLPMRRPLGRPSAFVTVQEGCDKFCTFCVVPYTRGMEASRPPERILREAGNLIDRGVREITLLGQNVNAYHGEGEGGTWSLARLIRALAEIDGLDRIRYTTSHPRDMDDDLIASHGELPKLMPYLHLPLQSGSDRILKAMNRKHTADDYRRVIDRLRQSRADILLSSDFIVGFPGESDDDFQATLSMVREIGYGAAYSFKYSARPGTPAAEKPLVDPAIADARLQELQALILDQQHAAQAAMVGREISVLYEKPGRRDGQMVGKSEHLMAVHLEDPTGKVGELVRARVVSSSANSLAADRLTAP